jgi:flagellar biosynthesis/type III secretory pathway protein FliH
MNTPLNSTRRDKVHSAPKKRQISNWNGFGSQNAMMVAAHAAINKYRKDELAAVKRNLFETKTEIGELKDALKKEQVNALDKELETYKLEGVGEKIVNKMIEDARAEGRAEGFAEGRKLALEEAKQYHSAWLATAKEAYDNSTWE